MTAAHAKPLRDLDWSRVKSVQENFLGGNWHFVEFLDGKACWLHTSGSVLEATGRKGE